ncbi:MAG: nucleotidyltransferase family protein [Candidatus Heimdallarchaeaceae archaeon]
MQEQLNLTRILKILHNNMTTIQSFGIMNIGVFGSYVRDMQENLSDLDLLIEFEPGKKSFDNFINLLNFLEDLLQIKVDLVTKKALSPHIGPNILEEVVYVEK